MMSPIKIRINIEGTKVCLIKSKIKEVLTLNSSTKKTTKENYCSSIKRKQNNFKRN